MWSSGDIFKFIGGITLGGGASFAWTGSIASSNTQTPCKFITQVYGETEVFLKQYPDCMEFWSGGEIFMVFAATLIGVVVGEKILKRLKSS